AFALGDPARWAAAGLVAGARHRLAKRYALAVLAVFGKRTMLEALLIPQLDAAKVEHAVLHGRKHALAAAAANALVKRGDDAEREMQPSAGIADLRAGDERRSLAEAGRRSGTASALRDILIDLAVLIR